MYSPAGSRYLFACFAVGVLCLLAYRSVVRPGLCPPAAVSLSFFHTAADAETEAGDVDENRVGEADSTNGDDVVGGPATSSPEDGRRSKMPPLPQLRHNFRRPNKLIQTYDADVDRRLTQLAARRATAGDPQLVELVRQLLDPPSEHIVKMSRQLLKTPQSNEADRLLQSKVNQIRRLFRSRTVRSSVVFSRTSFKLLNSPFPDREFEADRTKFYSMQHSPTQPDPNISGSQPRLRHVQTLSDDIEEDST